MLCRGRDTLSLVFTGILVMCALVITGLAGWTVFLRFSATTLPQTVSVAPQTPSGIYRLPVGVELSRSLDESSLAALPQPVRGFPLVPEFANWVRVGDRDMVLVPVLMTEKELPVRLTTAIVDPLRWGRAEPFSQQVVGRRSLWYMEPGSRMLYAVVLDPSPETRVVGVGFVAVKRLDESTYDVILEDARGTVLAAARGKLRKLDIRVGRGTLEPVEDDGEVQSTYKPRWRLAPEQLFLFSAR